MELWWREERSACCQPTMNGMSAAQMQQRHNFCRPTIVANHYAGSAGIAGAGQTLGWSPAEGLLLLFGARHVAKKLFHTFKKL
jgi:hypothetical protein